MRGEDRVKLVSDWRQESRMETRFLWALLCFFLFCPVHSLFWAMGSPVVVDPTRICRKTRRLRPKLAEICKNEPEIVKEVSKGSQMGTRECQYQFRNRRWNCSTTRRSLKKTLSRATRETSFLNAVTAAGVTYSVTQACSAGVLTQCTCDRGRRGRSAAPEGDWEWSGCGDNVVFGYKKSREMMDTWYRRKSDVKTLVLLHNNEAGRMSVKNYLRTECKCHGLSGSCTLRTCWKKMPLFREIGNRLKEKFDGASKVIPANDGKNVLPEGATIKPPSKEDLVYLEASPDYCDPNRKTGSLGTVGRICNHTSPGVEGCDLLCCGRGYSKEHVREKENCKCRFRWCCEVTCEICDVRRTISRCL